MKVLESGRRMVAMDSVKLNLNKDFRRLYGRGKSFVHPLLVTYIMRTKRNVVRYGITTGKKVGCAVERNRARRVITAAFRDCLPEITKGCDIVFVARRRILNSKSHEIAKIISKHLHDFGVCGN